MALLGRENGRFSQASEMVGFDRAEKWDGFIRA